MRSARIPAAWVRIVPVLALCLCIGTRASAASAPLGPNVWSVQLDGGLYAPFEASGASPKLGARYGKHYTSHLQGGLLTGWAFKRAKLETTAPGPQGLESHVELASADANLVPVMGFVQVDLTDKARLVPFLGFGLGYEWLVVHAVNHQTGEYTRLRYNNVAWESYGGLGLRFATIWRLNSELYYNGGSLQRKVTDPSTGAVRREAVHVNGVGIRVGLDMLFD